MIVEVIPDCLQLRIVSTVKSVDDRSEVGAFILSGVENILVEFFLNLVDTTDKQLVIIGLVDAAATVNGRVLASPIFNPSNSGSVWAL